MNKLLALLAGAALPAAAETPTHANVACPDAAYRQFDFWLGEWSVTDPAGQKAGDNVITSEEGGCLIVERWTSATGGTGQSYNFYDPVTLQWRQVWVSASAVIDYAGGLDNTGEMVLRGAIHYRDGRSAPFTGAWTPRPDGTVLQAFREYDSASQQWTDWFTGIYTRKT